MDIFLARQPIFDAECAVVGYELLFRDGINALFTHQDDNEATGQVMADSFFFGVEQLADGKLAYINTSREVLIEDYLLLLPPAFYAIELPGHIVAEERVLASVKKLKEKGYRIVLDDFVYRPEILPLTEYADLIKVDALATPHGEQKKILSAFANSGIHFLAEKVETHGAFTKAKEMGYSFFQGYFFSRPAVVSKREIPGVKIHYMQVLKQINQPELDVNQVEDIIKKDVSLTYSLLRYINSPFFGLRNEIRSIRHALIVLGQQEVKKWACLITLHHMGRDSPEILISHTLLRAKFCEALAPLSGFTDRDQDLFLMGMFSMVHALVGRPIEEILEEIPITEEIKAALFGTANRARVVLLLVLAYEKGDWQGFAKCAKYLKVPEEQIPTLYINSLIWANSPFAQ